MSAQAVANNIIHEINPSWLFLVGIAGGVPDNEFSLGDVVLASALHDFSFGGVGNDGQRTYHFSGGTMHPEVERFLQTKITGRNRKKLMNLAGFGRKKFQSHPSVLTDPYAEKDAFYGSPSFREETKRRLLRRFPDWRRRGGPTLWPGPCANGNLLVKDSELLKTWQECARQIVDIDTELSGVYEAARSAGRQNYPLLAIRGLSDIVGLRRNPDWTDYACETAAAVAVAILRSDFIDFSRSGR